MYQMTTHNTHTHTTHTTHKHTQHTNTHNTQTHTTHTHTTHTTHKHTHTQTHTTHKHTHTHTPNQGVSFKAIDTIHHFPYNVIFLLCFIIIILYFILFIAQLHMQPYLPSFYHNNKLLHSILSINVS